MKGTGTCRLRCLSQNRIGFHTHKISKRNYGATCVRQESTTVVVLSRSANYDRDRSPTRNCINCIRLAPLCAMVMEVPNSLTNRLVCISSLIFLLFFLLIIRWETGCVCLIRIVTCQSSDKQS